MPFANGRVAVVTGANRGLGLETCRQLADQQYRVVLTARSWVAARDAAGPTGVDHVRLEVTDTASIEEAAREVQGRYGHVDVLVNNAGVLMDGFDGRVARRTVAVNLFGAMSVTDAFLTLLSDSASIVMVSSGLGELSCLSPALRAQFEDQALTRGRLVELMEAFLRDVEDGAYKARGWPESAYSVSKSA